MKLWRQGQVWRQFALAPIARKPTQRAPHISSGTGAQQHTHYSCKHRGISSKHTHTQKELISNIHIQTDRQAGRQAEAQLRYISTF
jgi:hypothetical protein